MRRRRFTNPDQHELAAERLNAGVGPFEPLPEQLRQFNGKRLVMFFFLGVFAVVVAHGGSGSSKPLPVTGSCTKPGFAFDHDSVRAYGTVRWSVAGPTGSSVIITADSESADRGRVSEAVQIKDCKASGRFGVTLKEGHHVLRVFLRSAGGELRVLGQRGLEVA